MATDLWQNTSKLWCQSTGSFSTSPARRALYVFERRMKWKTSASTTLYGSACFLSSSTRMKSEFAPVNSSQRAMIYLVVEPHVPGLPA